LPVLRNQGVDQITGPRRIRLTARPRARNTEFASYLGDGPSGNDGVGDRETFSRAASTDDAIPTNGGQTTISA